ncbi:MAG: TetR/AcrR family transcriptional regulator [Marinoscillum sp.]
MPKSTFQNLDNSKRKQITEAFLREFAIKTFDEASITVVVKQLGIAKGSIYQYFKDKLDLYMYLIQECSIVKMSYVQSIKREDHPDFWAYFRNLYAAGYEFDAQNPLQSHFLHNLIQNLNSPSVKPLFDQMMGQTIAGFETLVAKEIELGLFRSDVPVKTMAFMLYKVGVGIQEYLEHTKIIEPKQSIYKNQPVYQNKKDFLLATVDEFISLIKPTFNKSPLI